ncbi:hypothetical protein GCM10008986_08610 [Salinibacillus aidingensis]|uniref:STAS domain-containing protein n=1 Tax=Salinibacillus aidingensis TaxID=237684 RepID=A0ABN1AWY3_9BACI
MKKYDIQVQHEKKTIDMVVRGSFSEQDVQNFMRDYQNAVSSIKAGEYTLEIDCTNLDILTQDMVPQMEASLNMYKESGFHTVQLNIRNNAVLKLQLHRLARSIGLKNAKTVDV